MVATRGFSLVVYGHEAFIVGLKDVVNIEGPELFVSPRLPRHCLASVRHHVLGKQLFGGLSDWITNTLIIILDLRQSHSDLEEFIPAQRFVIVGFKIDFLKVDSNECPIDILLTQILVNDTPLLADVGVIKPANDWVEFWVCYTVNVLVFEHRKVLAKDTVHFVDFILVLDELCNFHVLLI